MIVSIKWINDIKKKALKLLEGKHFDTFERYLNTKTNELESAREIAGILEKNFKKRDSIIRKIKVLDAKFHKNRGLIDQLKG